MLTTEDGDVDSEMHWVTDECRGSQRMEIMNKIREECQSTSDVLATLQGRAAMEELPTCQFCRRKHAEASSPCTMEKVTHIISARLGGIIILRSHLETSWPGRTITVNILGMFTVMY